MDIKIYIPSMCTCIHGMHNIMYVFVVVDKVKKKKRKEGKKGLLLTRLTLIFPTGKIPKLMVTLWIYCFTFVFETWRP